MANITSSVPGTPDVGTVCKSWLSLGIHNYIKIFIIGGLFYCLFRGEIETIVGHEFIITNEKTLNKHCIDLKIPAAVIYPGSIFLGAIVFDILSTGLSSVNNNIAISLWIISVILIAAGIYRLLGTVSAIESVTITSSEYSEKLPQAVKTALMEIEEAKRPVPFVYFTETQFPLHLQPHSKKDLEASISLANGQYADDVEIHFALSPGLTFVDKQTYTFSKDHTYKNYTCYKYSRPKILRGMTYHDLITIESSSTQGSLKMIYYIFCKGFWMDNPVELEIVVD